MHKHLFASLVLTLAFMSFTVAQPLAEHVPGDAVVYVGWRGADDPGDGYAGSNLEALRDATELPEAIEQILMLIEQTNAHDAEVAMVTGMVRTIGRASWRKPTAGYLQATGNPDLPVRWVMLWRADGADADVLQAQLNTLAEEAERNTRSMHGPMLHVNRTDMLVSLTIGQLPTEGITADADAEAEPGAAAVADTSSLSDNTDFRQTLTRVNPDGVLVVYADAAGLIELIDSGFDAEGNPGDLAMWHKVRGALGIDGLNAVAYSAGFDGKDWRTDLFVDAPAPRTGAMTLLDGEPITDNELGVVPAEATWVVATRFDLGALLDAVRKAADEIDPQARPKLEDALLQANRMTGIDIEADLIRSLGSAWIAYTDPGATGSGMMGLCLVNELKDAEKAGRAMSALQALANAMMGQMAGGPPRQGEPEMLVRFRTTTHDGMTVNTLGIPFLAPAWSVHEGRLYVGLYPQSVLTAGDRLRAGGGSIVTNEKFQAVRERLDASDASSIVFADLPETAEDAYPNLVMMSQLGTGMLAMFGSDTMPMLLPPFFQIEPHLAPAGQASWSDDAGYHARSVSPFPGSMMLGPQGATNATMTVPLMAGITLPALGAARRSARQMKTTTQCRGIVQSRITHASANNEQVTDDIAELFEWNAFSVEYVISPRSNVVLPREFNQWDMPRQKQWVRENASFILIPDLKLDIDSNTVCVFERPDHTYGGGMSVGFNDGSATFEVDERAVRAMIEQQTGKTLEELIERQQQYQPPAE